MIKDLKYIVNYYNLPYEIKVLSSDLVPSLTYKGFFSFLYFPYNSSEILKQDRYNLPFTFSRAIKHFKIYLNE